MEFISYSEALRIVSSNKFEKTIETVSLENANGKFLAEDLIADRDFPPFDRVTMDGIAINYSTFQNGQRKFQIQGLAAAGTPQGVLPDSNGCLEVMTGAILPRDTDTVVRYEDITIVDGLATVNEIELNARQNVHFRGIDRKKGEVIVPKARFLSAPELSIAATVGKSRIKVVELPKAAIISTGDELVDVNSTPEPYQIRISNSHGIEATLQDWGIGSELFHLNDDEREIETSLKEIFESFNLIVIIGGVSKGKFDFLPVVLEKLGVEKLFHKVKQRPGKPFWFGKSSKNIVFALPGNPVSSFMCAQIYIRQWLLASLGIEIKEKTGVLSETVTFNKELTYFLECKSHIDNDAVLQLDPVIGHGSGDFANLVDADGFVILPPERNTFKKGEKHIFVPYRNKI